MPVAGGSTGFPGARGNAADSNGDKGKTSPQGGQGAAVPDSALLCGGGAAPQGGSPDSQILGCDENTSFNGITTAFTYLLAARPPNI